MSYTHVTMKSATTSRGGAREWEVQRPFVLPCAMCGVRESWQGSVIALAGHPSI